MTATLTTTTEKVCNTGNNCKQQYEQILVETLLQCLTFCIHQQVEEEKRVENMITQ